MSLPVVKKSGHTIVTDTNKPATGAVVANNAKPMPVHKDTGFNPDKINSYLNAFDLFAHAFANIFGIATHVNETDPKTGETTSLPRAIGEIAGEVATVAAGASATVFSGGAADTSGKVAEIAATVSALSPMVEALTNTVTDVVGAVNDHTDTLAAHETRLAAVTSTAAGAAPAGGEGA